MDSGAWDAENQADFVMVAYIIDGGAPHGGTVAIANPAPNFSPYAQPAQESSVEIVRRFLREAGVLKGLLTGDRMSYAVLSAVV